MQPEILQISFDYKYKITYSNEVNKLDSARFMAQNASKFDDSHLGNAFCCKQDTKLEVVIQLMKLNYFPSDNIFYKMIREGLYKQIHFFLHFSEKSRKYCLGILSAHQFLHACASRDIEAVKYYLAMPQFDVNVVTSGGVCICIILILF